MNRYFHPSLSPLFLSLKVSRELIKILKNPSLSLAWQEALTALIAIARASPSEENNNNNNINNTYAISLETLFGSKKNIFEIYKSVEKVLESSLPSTDSGLLSYWWPHNFGAYGNAAFVIQTLFVLSETHDTWNIGGESNRKKEEEYYKSWYDSFEVDDNGGDSDKENDYNNNENNNIKKTSEDIHHNEDESNKNNDKNNENNDENEEGNKDESKDEFEDEGIEMVGSFVQHLFHNLSTTSHFKTNSYDDEKQWIDSRTTMISALRRLLLLFPPNLIAEELNSTLKRKVNPEETLKAVTKPLIAWIVPLCHKEGISYVEYAQALLQLCYRVSRAKYYIPFKII